MNAAEFEVAVRAVVTDYQHETLVNQVEALRLALLVVRLKLYAGVQTQGWQVQPELFAYIDGALDIGKVG
jgi:hypothetical protein